MGVCGPRHAEAALPLGNTRYPLYRRLGGPQGRSGRKRKISPPPGFDPRTVQPVASRYTDYATPARSFKTTYYISLVTPQNNPLNGGGMEVETLILSLEVRLLFISDRK
jgi:hypothetical protein